MLIDVNTSLGHWPFARFAVNDAAGLAAHLRAEGIGGALVSNMETALFPDPDLPNRDLIEAVAPFPGLYPLGTVDPTLSHWRECFERCYDAVGLNTVRLLPNYHRYGLDHPQVDALVEVLLRREHPVLVVQMRLEDERNQYPLMQVPGVPVAQIVALTQRHPELPVLCLCPYRQEAFDLVAATVRVAVDIAFIESLDTLASVLTRMPAERVFFGSHTPMLYTRAAVMKLEHGSADDAARRAIGQGNACRLFGLAALSR